MLYIIIFNHLQQKHVPDIANYVVLGYNIQTINVLDHLHQNMINIDILLEMNSNVMNSIKRTRHNTKVSMKKLSAFDVNYATVHLNHTIDLNRHLLLNIIFTIGQFQRHVLVTYQQHVSHGIHRIKTIIHGVILICLLTVKQH